MASYAVATTGLVVVFVIFMLIGRENLRDRMILAGGGHQIVQALGEAQQVEDADDASAATVRQAKGNADLERPSPTPAARTPLPHGVSVTVRCLPAHDEADQIAGLMLAQVLQRRGFTVDVQDNASLASELVASVDPHTSDIVVISALPPKAARCTADIS